MLDRIRIVMIETTHPGNIGAAARALKTMGLSDLRLVRPRDFPSDEARARSSGAGDVLERAQVCESLEEALEGATMVIGTSARQRRIPWPCQPPRKMAQSLAPVLEQEKVAVLFGREDRGLTNDELRRCNFHVSIPSNEAYGVLNVAAAIQLICYEMRMAVEGDGFDRPVTRSRQHKLSVPDMEWDAPPASNNEVENFLEHFEQAIVESGFLDPDNPAQVMTRMRRLFLRARPDKMEISMLRGILVSFQRHGAERSAADEASQCSGDQQDGDQQNV